jgi:hypothetical protein
MEQITMNCGLFLRFPLTRKNGTGAATFAAFATSDPLQTRHEIKRRILAKLCARMYRLKRESS